MKHLLEDFVPYDQSVRWRIHDAYHSGRGTAAFTEGEVPHAATSSYFVARQHARFLLHLVSELERTGSLRPDEEVAVLELGCGLGRFAANFIQALATGCGQPGRRLVPRLRYVLSDYAESSVREAILHSALGELVASGSVVPALFDFRRPRDLLSLEGAPIQLRLTAIVASYVCCASPVKIIRKVSSGFEQQRLRIEVELPPEESVADGVATATRLEEFLQSPTRANLMKSFELSSDWQPVKLDDLFARQIHADVIRAALQPYADATITYPAVFLELLQDIAPLMKPGGIALVSDYGLCDAAQLEGLREGAPMIYGNSMSHAINFSVFDAFCRVSDRGLVRTRRQPSEFQTVAVRFEPDMPRALKVAFRRSLGTAEDADSLADFAAAAQEACSARKFERAVRFYRRCLQFEPQSIEYLYRLGDACIEAGYYQLALPYLLRGAKLDQANLVDFQFQLGRVWYSLKQPRKALRCYRLSLEYSDHPATHCNVGLVYEALGRRDDALTSYRRALELDPARELARRRVSSIEARELDETTGSDARTA